MIANEEKIECQGIEGSYIAIKISFFHIFLVPHLHERALIRIISHSKWSPLVLTQLSYSYYWLVYFVLAFCLVYFVLIFT